MAPSITHEMRLYTREIHKISDDLVNAKLAFGKYLFVFKMFRNYKEIY
jgi:hypothetical protein